MKTLFSTALAAVLLCALPQGARAEEEDAEVTRMAKEHYKLGLEAYKSGKFDVAIKELKKAYLLKRLPALLLNIGATYRKMGDLDLAIHFYQKYLDEAPAEAKDRPEVQKTLAEVKAQKAGGPPPEEAPAAPAAEKPARPESREEAPPREDAPPRPAAPSAMPREFTHAVIDAAPPETPIDVRVSMPVMKGVKVYVYYRPPGENDFKAVLMKRRGTEKVGRIPADAVTGTSLQYYIEARDPAGTVVKSSGSQANPNIVMVDPTAKPQVLASRAGEEEAAEPQEERKRPTRNMDEESAPTTGHLEDERPGKRQAQKRGAGQHQKMGPLMLGGIITAAIGVAIAGGLGVTGLILAKQNSDALTTDSHNPVDPNGNQIFFNNDPVASDMKLPQAATLQSRGKLWNSLGIAGITVGSIAAVAGLAMITTEVVLKGQRDRPHRRTRRRRVIEEEEVSKNWYLAPGVSREGAQVVGGFTF
jgi:hypothetical protein